jgi:hypothetical protein
MNLDALGIRQTQIEYLKSPGPKGRAGSNPALGTIQGTHVHVSLAMFRSVILHSVTPIGNCIDAVPFN